MVCEIRVKMCLIIGFLSVFIVKIYMIWFNMEFSIKYKIFLNGDWNLIDLWFICVFFLLLSVIIGFLVF